jgi:hypothetical protein
VTPPRLTTSPPQAAKIGRVTQERLRPLAIDGLVLYDIDDESDRNPDERPFPFLPTMDPADYLARDLAGLEVPAIVYRAVGKHREDRLRSWLEQQDPSRALVVFVGSSSRQKAVLTSLARAYELREEVQSELPLGGVAIAERHARLGDEHLRLIAKQAAGCSFFIAQIVYDINAAKNLISDYHHACAKQNLKAVPTVFSFSVCGSLKTLEFLRWFGVAVPRWIENELRYADDTLDASYEQAVATALDLIAFLPPFGGPVRAQRRERLDPQGRDRGLGAAGHPVGSRAAPLNPLPAREVGNPGDKIETCDRSAPRRPMRTTDASKRVPTRPRVPDCGHIRAIGTTAVPGQISGAAGGGRSRRRWASTAAPDGAHPPQAGAGPASMRHCQS